jgi:hypothetical protein
MNPSPASSIAASFASDSRQPPSPAAGGGLDFEAEQRDRAHRPWDALRLINQVSSTGMVNSSFSR